MGWITTVLFWAAVGLTIAKVMYDTGNGTLRREFFALGVGVEVAVVLALVLEVMR